LLQSCSLRLRFGCCGGSGGSFYAHEPVDTSPPVRLFTWRRFYVGLNDGYAWGSGDPTVISYSINSGTLAAIDPSGFLGAGQVGYNAQFGNFVLGAEADIRGGWVDGYSAGNVVGFGEGSTSSDLNWLSAIRARAGFAADRMLIYATGGVAWADTDFTTGTWLLRNANADRIGAWLCGGMA
jgi:outer membrane immunogenic protein